MSEPFLGQIMPVGFNFAPRGWALCDGQLLSISQNQAVFSLLGTTFGGDGRTTFALPDLRGRHPIHPGTGPGLPTVLLGQRSGTHSYPITTGHLPSHFHSFAVPAVDDDANQSNATGNSLANINGNIYSSDTPDTTLRSEITGNTGASQPLTVTEPFLGILHCIALQGIFPSRNRSQPIIANPAYNK